MAEVEGRGDKVGRRGGGGGLEEMYIVNKREKRQ